MVEVCLSSNVQILKVAGTDHPLSAYMANDVPFALATDDQGVSRSSMAGEYVRAVSDQGLGYLDLKKVARTSLEHSFLPGDSLWADFVAGGATPVSACAATDTMGVGDPPDANCQAFIDSSEKATLQWKLEGRFRAFESTQ
jgi:adenosine deaminase